MKYDAIFVGSRIAGSVTAMLLARKGFRVLVVDRNTFPSDTISTHIIWQQGVNLLSQYGLTHRFVGLGAPPLDTMTLDFGAFALRGALPSVGTAQHAYAPRRTKLDAMLVQAAMEAGAEVREGFLLEDLLFDDNARVIGIRGRDRSGASVVEHASCIIGADGRYSTIARLVQAEAYNTRPSLTCWYYTYWSGLPQSQLRLFSRPSNAIGVIPTNDGCFCVGVAWRHSEFGSVKTDIERHYLAALDAAPELKQEVMSGRREERFYGTADIPNYFRRPYGNGWALVGDAGYHRDPILAQGISDALRDAGLLARTLEKIWVAGETWDTAMASYESARNEAVKDIYELNTEYASLEPPPADVQQLLFALQANAEDTSRFMGTITGAVPVSEFYAPSNVARIMRESSGRVSGAAVTARM
jgi:2-polyprenyl-6-methoxyphenol hydroxylase-like FAD-dependent oxidoreductase